MTLTLKRLRRQVDTAKNRVASILDSAKNRTWNGKTLLQYRGDYTGYCQYVLKSIPTPDQRHLADQVDAGVHRIFCRAGHVVGKSWSCASIVSYLYDTYPECIIITTAPRLDSVRKIIWRELRGMRRKAGLGGFTGPRSIQMESNENHLAYGTTARTHAHLQGAHGVRVFIIIDEAVGVEAEFWEAIETMLSGDEYCLIAIYNPTTTACQAYAEEKKKTSYVHTISCLNHPNIAEELRGERPDYPAATRLAWVAEHIQVWCDPLHESDTPKPTDFQFPPPETAKEVCSTITMSPGQWWRPGPIAEARILGRWPTSAVNTFWSEALLNKCRNNKFPINERHRVAIGCDVARYGDDMTEMVVRQGLVILHHEAHSGWTGDVTAGRLKQLCELYHGPEDSHKVRVYIDETGGFGSGVIDHAGIGNDTYNFTGVNSSSTEGIDKNLHRNVRTALWATTAEVARNPHHGIDMSRLIEGSFQELSKQCLAQPYKIMPNGAIWALPKDGVKELIKRSPDTADALNLCFWQE